MTQLQATLDHLNLSVTNLDESLNWYNRIFGFERVEGGLYEGEPWAIIRRGDSMLALYQDPTLKAPDSVKGAHRLYHFGLKVSDRAAWEEILAREKPQITMDATRRPHSVSWYVLDPTGYEIEVTAWDKDRVSFAGLS